MNNKLIGILAAIALGVCIYFLAFSTPTQADYLPILGERDFQNGDTIYATVPKFKFINQDSAIVTEADYENKVYVVDFFFTHCPTICPKVTKQMLRVYDTFKDESRVMLLSHSIDVKHDTVGRLREYANGISIKAPKWNMVTGVKQEIYAIAKSYYSVAKEDADSPGGFDHSGRLILVDEAKHIRAFCDGTKPEEVDLFMLQMKMLLNEKEKNPYKKR